MDLTSFEGNLILIVLILTGVTLFLSIVNAIYLSKINQLLSKARSASAARTQPATVPPQSFQAAEQPPVTAVPRAAARPPVAEISTDIPDGVRRICESYALESVIISSPDGLLVSSYGSAHAEADAAEYSQIYAAGKKPPDPMVSIAGLTHRGTALVCVIKSRKRLDGKELHSIREEVELLLNRWL